MGIDQSLTKTGIVILEDNEVLHHEIIITDKTSLDTYHDILSRAKFIANSIVELDLEYNVDHWILEGLSFGSNGAATRNLAILFAIICNHMSEVNPKTVAPTTLKKFATGSGAASKDRMVEAICEHDYEFYSTITDIPKSKGRQDLADAFWLAHYLKEKLIDENC